MKKATLFLFFSFIGCLALFLANAPESGQNLSEDQNPKKNLQSAKAEKKVLTEASSPLGKKNTNRAATVFAQKGSRVPSTAPERSEDTLYKKNSHASILDEITLQVLDSREAPLKGQKDSEEIKRKISLRKTSFKYPYLIVEESFREGLSGREQVGTLKAMVADHLLINLNPQTDLESARQRFEDLNCSLGEKIATGIYIVEIQGPPSISKHYEKRALLGEIEEVAEVVEPDYFLTISRMPDDSGFSRLWGMHNTGQTGGSVDKDVDGPEAWNLSTGSKNVLGAVIDTGIDREHEDLMVNMWTNPGEIAGNGLDDDGNGYVDDVHGWDFVNNDNNPYDDNGHGTHCAGTIGGVGNNGKGVAGVAWNVSMVGIKFLSRSGSGATSDAVKSVAYATGIGVDFSSNSWGGGGASSSLKRVIEEADQQGIAFIAAAGNHGANNDVSPSYPASYDLNNVIAVGAHASTGKSASFSCYGQRSVDLFAPGVNTYSTVPGNKYASFSGTSMATPHVAGAYALIQSMRPEWGVEQIKASLMTSTDEEASLREKCVTGGRLNVFEALQAEPAKEKLIAINPTELDFGKIAKNAKQNMEFSISNSGSQATTLSNAFLTGNPAFALSLTTPFQIPAGTQIKGSIILEAGAEGLYQAELILESDAENAPRLPVPLSAEVIATPNLAVTPESLHFDLREGQKKTQSITLSNTGDGNLHYEIKFPSAANWLASPFPSTNKALETSFAGGNGHKGNYLEVEVLASSGIQVDSMTGHFRGSGEVKVWRRDGRIEEAVKSKDGWNEVVSAQVSTSGQEKKKFPVDFQLSPGKHTLLFSNSGSIKYTNATFGSVAASDENLSILVGYGTGRTSPSGTQSLYEGRKWNGTFHYSIASKENKGSLSEGQSIRIETIANADNLPSEYEEAYLCVTSNDPEEPEKLIKVSARMLSENAGLVFRPSSLTFGDTYRGQTAERDLVMSNAGTKDLTINQFAFRNSDFSHRLSLPITLRSGDQRTETIYFSPKTSGQIESSALVLTDEEGGTTRSLQVSGRGSIAPEMAISPPSLSATLKSAKQKALNLMISNSGGSPLSWTLKGATTGGGKALATPFFAQSHFLPLTKGSPDNRKGMPISTLGGGPDFYGYNWTGSFEPSGPTHQWKDISGSGRVLPQASGEDDGFDKVITPFPVELYGKTYKEVFVSSNGYLTLERGSSKHGHFPLPSTMMPGNLIAPFAMDLDPSRGGEVYLQQDANEVLVQWNKVKDFAGMGEYTFQVSLNRNGVVYFHYEKMDGKVERATTGIQNATADQALLVAYNNKQIRTESTIRLSTSPKWLFAEKTSGIVAGGENLTIPIALKSGSILAGAYEAIIEIKGNAPGNPATTVPVKLIVEATRILEINPLSVDFGEVEVGVTRENSVQLTNIGNAPITMDQINLDSSFFEAVSSINTLAPGETSSITLQFSPEDGTSYADRCELISNAENSPTALTLAGKGLATPKFKVTPGSISISLPAGEKTTTLASLANEGKASGNFTLMEIRNENSVRIADGLSSNLQETVDPFAAEHVPNRLIVRYKDGQTQFASSGILTESVKVVRKLGKARNGENGLRALSGLNMALVETAQNSNLQEVAKALSMDPAVAYVEPDYLRRGSILPDDPDWSQQYALKKIQAPEAWERTKGSPEVIVAVIDTGIDYNHKDLQGNLWKNPGEVPGNQKDDDGNGYVDDVYGWDFHNDDNTPMDGNRHGTHVAGTIAAASNNGLQVAGVAWNAKLVALKFLSDRGWGSVSNAIDAVAYCTAMNFPISNNSWGGGGSSKAMQEAIERAAQSGHLFCAAAGNSGTNNDAKPHYPSSYLSPNILSVAASDSSDRLASFSCYGKTSVDLAAPGVGILNLIPGNRIGRLSGTSMATPHVAGAAALLLSINPNAGFAEIKQTLMNSVDPISSFEGKLAAPGRLNLFKALQGSSAGWLRVSPENGKVETSQSTELTFSIDASELMAGKRRAVVSFATNDPASRILQVPVEVTITGEPEITTDKESLDFGELWVGRENSLQLIISNSGTDLLEISGMSLGTNEFSVSPSTLSIQPGAKEVVSVLARPVKSDVYSTNLTITSNARNRSVLKIPVRLEAILAPALEFSPQSLSLILEPGHTGPKTIKISNDGEAQGSWETEIVEIGNSRSRIRNVSATIDALNKRKPEFLTPGTPSDGTSVLAAEIGTTGAIRLAGGNPTSNFEVAILGANTTAKNLDVAKGLAETKRFAGITLINLQAVTPNVGELEAFDSVLVYNNYNYADAKGLGDQLASYADQGYGVVTMVFEGSVFGSIGGRWKEENYEVFAQSSKDTRNWSGLGNIAMPNHPLLEDVETFLGSYRLNFNGPANGSSLVATWKDGLPLIACRNEPANVVGLNFYPVSGRIPLQSKGWDVETDGWTLMANALEWTAQGARLNWLKAERVSGVVDGKQSDDLNLTLDATDLGEGNYSAEMRFSSNDPENPYQTVSVMLVVRENMAPIALPSAITIAEDSSKSFQLEGFDPEGDPITFLLVNQPSNGKLSGATPALNYQPNPNFNGTDEFSFKVSDGTRESAVANVQILVSPVNDPPWARSENLNSIEDEFVVLSLKFGDPDGDPLRLDFTLQPQHGFVIEDNGDWVYLPNPHYNGKEVIKFKAFDGALESNEATLTLEIEPSNDAPIASDSTLSVEEGKSVIFEPVANDLDGDAVNYELVAAPEHGRLETSANGRWTFTPFAGYNGSDYLTFRPSDGKLSGNLARVNFEVIPRNDSPIVASSTFALIEDGELKVKLIASDPEGDNLTFRITGSPENGTLSGNGPTYSYKPDANFNGTDVFAVVANDGKSDSQPGVVTLLVTGENDAPKLNTGIGTLSASYRETTFRMKLEAEDPDGDALVYSLVEKPANGICSIDGDQLVYSPNPGFTGMELITIRVSDGSLSDSATMTLPIEEHPDSIGLFVPGLDSTEGKAFLKSLYEMNDQLRMTGEFLIKLQDQKTANGFSGRLSDQTAGEQAIGFGQWITSIGSLQPGDSFVFHPKTSGKISSCQVTAVQEESGELDDGSGKEGSLPDLGDTDKSSEEKDEPMDPGKTPDSPDPSSAPTEIPLLTITNLPGVVANEQVANWYSLNGLGNFFDAGNGWVYQAEMGWCFTKICQEDLSLWVYGKGLGWMWIKSDFPNMCYMEGELVNGWSYFPKKSITEAGLLYDYTNESWIKLN